MRVTAAQLCAPSRGTGADACPLRQIGQFLAARMDPPVSRICALEKCRQLEVVGDDGGNVFETVDGDVDLVPLERLFELLDEQPLAADGCQRYVAPLVAG